MPRAKKDPSVRARRNKASTQAMLSTVELADPVAIAVALEELTVSQLRAQIDAANVGRPADQMIAKTGAKAKLVAALVAASNPVPDLPPCPPRYDADGFEVPREWHMQTIAWWNDAWTSPMSMQWDDSDFHNMSVLALLYDDIWTADGPRARSQALGEYRLQRADLGLSPLARRRLEWTIETVEQAKERGKQRRTNGSNPAPQPAAGNPETDPRLYLVN